MHKLIASPFLGNYLLVRPGQPNGVKIPHARYKELAQVVYLSEGLSTLGFLCTMDLAA